MIRKKLRPYVTDEMYYILVRTLGPLRFTAARIWISILFLWSHTFGALRYLSNEDCRIWRRSMLAMLKEYYQAVFNIRIMPVVYTFALAKIEVIRKTYDCDINNPIVILCVKNDLRKIQMLVGHYRKLGIKRFAFLDNGSDDGTYEWLLEQSDIDIYRCYGKYGSFIKEGWINRIASHYGFDRWVIFTDSDELIVYEGMEMHPIEEVVRFGNKHGIKRFKALMMDAYSNGEMFGKTDGIKKEYCWIDSDSYVERNERVGKTDIVMFDGGPRHRLMRIDDYMSKHPLLYFEKGTISDNAHYQYPHEEIGKAPCNLGILHYKFIDTDLKEFEKRAMKGSGFYNEGEHYKAYLGYYKSNDKTSFMYEGSIEFKDSSSLMQIEYIKPITFDIK